MRFLKSRYFLDAVEENFCFLVEHLPLWDLIYTELRHLERVTYCGDLRVVPRWDIGTYSLDLLCFAPRGFKVMVHGCFYETVEGREVYPPHEGRGADQRSVLTPWGITILPSQHLWLEDEECQEAFNCLWYYTYYYGQETFDESSLTDENLKRFFDFFEAHPYPVLESFVLRVGL